MLHSVRQAETSDRIGIYGLERVCFPDPYPTCLLDDLLQKETKRFFVAVQEGKIIGYTVATAEGHIVSVAVHPHYRRRGIGTALLSRVVQELVGESIDEIYLEVRKGNMVAVSFYERLGFRRSSEIRHYYGDGEDALVLRRSAQMPATSDV